VRLTKYFSIANSGHGDEDIPHGSGDISQISIDLLLKESHGIAKNKQGHDHRDHEDLDRVLLHNGFNGEGVIGITAVNGADPL